ncbi:uncharacterized protein [Rutidosis leptorrhynchoides]|uniref:uncharacterized protein n=1 Tax=Rutidosis leptorrhynchoides TaxID=125765 RepID=UPI003A98DCB2
MEKKGLFHRGVKAKNGSSFEDIELVAEQQITVHTVAGANMTTFTIVSVKHVLLGGGCICTTECDGNERNALQLYKIIMEGFLVTMHIISSTFLRAYLLSYF